MLIYWGKSRKIALDMFIFVFHSASVFKYAVLLISISAIHFGIDASRQKWKNKDFCLSSERSMCQVVCFFTSSILLIYIIYKYLQRREFVFGFKFGNLAFTHSWRYLLIYYLRTFSRRRKTKGAKNQAKNSRKSNFFVEGG